MDYEMIAKKAGWFQDNDDGKWYALDMLDGETEFPGPFETAQEACQHDGLIQ